MKGEARIKKERGNHERRIGEKERGRGRGRRRIRNQEEEEGKEMVEGVWEEGR